MKNSKKVKCKNSRNKVIQEKGLASFFSKANKKGITLIALIITIIVLLILAGVSIATLAGDNGVLTKATKAKEETRRAEADDAIRLIANEWQIERHKSDRKTLEEFLNGKVPSELDKVTKNADGSYTVEVNGYKGTIGADGILVGDITKAGTTEDTPPSEEIEFDQAKADSMLDNTENIDVTTSDGKFKLPAGFKVAGDSGETIDEGIVVEDRTGNQFVWIPVSKENFETEFVRRAGYEDGSIQDISSYGEADGTGNNSKIEEIDSIKNEAKAMYDSVKNNGGFYIGRYETGFEGDSPKTNYTYYETKTEANVATEVAKLVVKKGAQVYNHVPWGAKMNDISATNNGSDTNPKFVIGAVELARKFASVKGYNTNKVHSTLCYGVQWDTALNFIDPGYTGYAKDSTGMGWYYDNYNSTSDGNTESNPNYITGTDLKYSAEPNVIKNKQKNIYDMAGNVREWTMEAYNANVRAVRGGYYNWTGTSHPASYRYRNHPSYNFEYVGFRLALYL